MYNIICETNTKKEMDLRDKRDIVRPATVKANCMANGRRNIYFCNNVSKGECWENCITSGNGVEVVKGNTGVGSRQ